MHIYHMTALIVHGAGSAHKKAVASSQTNKNLLLSLRNTSRSN